MRFRTGQFWLIFLSLYAGHVAHSSKVVEAKVQVISRRIKRSSFEKVNYAYHVKVSAFGVTHDLNLQRAADSIFMSDFKFNEVDVDENGQTVWRQSTMSSEELIAIEEHIYVDVSKNTAVRVGHLDGEFILNGIVNGARIRHRRDAGTEVEREEILQSPQNNQNDYETYEIPPSIEGRAGMAPNAELMLQPELHFVIDFALSKLFEFNRDKVMEYMAIMVNSVNNKYALTNDKKTVHIVCKFVGLTLIMSEAGQPFIADALEKSGKYNFSKISDSYKRWVFQNLVNFGNHDVTPLQLGVEFTQVGIRGLATVPGACIFMANRNDGRASLACPCSQDLGAYYSGVLTLAHELAHSFGSQHDGEGDSTSCPPEDGFIMSYKGWGSINKFKLSSCTLAAIRKYVLTSTAKCLREESATIIHRSELSPGTLVDSKRICTELRGNRSRVSRGRQTNDDTCRNTICKLGFTEQVANEIPGNGAPCGKTGKCKNGWCVAPGPPLTLDELCVDNHQIGSEQKYDTNVVQDICITGKLACVSNLGGTPFKDSYQIMIVPGTTCGPNAVCFNKKCTSINQIKDPNELCQVRTGKVEAKAGPARMSPNNKCIELQTCMYGSEFEEVQVPLDFKNCTTPSQKPKKLGELTEKEQCIVVTGNLNANGVLEGQCKIKCTFGNSVVFLNETKNGSPCQVGAAGGTCQEGVCVTISIDIITLSFDTEKPNRKKGMSVTHACVELTSMPDALAISPPGSGQVNRDVLCSNLHCATKDGKRYRANNFTPDGARCGPLMG